jgi:hypothetical protein
MQDITENGQTQEQKQPVSKKNNKKLDTPYGMETSTRLSRTKDKGNKKQKKRGVCPTVSRTEHSYIQTACEI